MKPIQQKTTQRMFIILLMIFSCLSATAEVHYEYVRINGLEYEISYDLDDPTYVPHASLNGGYWEWNDSLGQSTLSPIQYEDWNTDSVLYLPEIVGGYPLTEILNGAFGSSTNIKHVEIPATVNLIRSGAFSHSSLETITFYDTFHDEETTYYIDPNLIAPIIFEDNDPEFGWYRGVFQGCKRLISVNSSRPINNIPQLMCRDCPELRTILFNNEEMTLEAIGDGAFFNCTSLQNISLPDSVKVIGNCAFFNCANLQHISLPDSVKVIGNGAFAKCASLENIHLPEGITTIGDYGFAECNMLNNINLQPSLQYIGKAAFLNCWAFTSISFPDAITAINDYTFCDCHNLTDTNFNNINTFGKSSFSGCNKLTSINLDKAQSIGENAFTGGSWRWHVYCDSDNSNSPFIAGEATWNNGNWGSLKNITLGKDVSSIFRSAFDGHVLDTITCMAPIPPVFGNTYWTIFNDQTYNTALLRVPNVVVDTYRNADGWKYFNNIEGFTIMGNGDVNGDGDLSIGDVTVFIDTLLGGQSDTINPINADVNGDGQLSIGDITTLIDQLLSNN